MVPWQIQLEERFRGNIIDLRSHCEFDLSSEIGVFFIYSI